MYPPHETGTILPTFLTFCAFIVIGEGLVFITRGVFNILRSAIGPLKLPKWMHRSSSGASVLPPWEPTQRPGGDGPDLPSPPTRIGGYGNYSPHSNEL